MTRTLPLAPRRPLPQPLPRPRALAALLLLAAAASPAQQGTGSSYADAQKPQPPLDDERIAPDPAALQRQLGAILGEEGVPGGAVVLAPPQGDAIISALGQADPLQRRPVTPQTTFVAGPLSPLLVGLTAARLAAAEAEAAATDPHAHGAVPHPEHAGESAPDFSALPQDLLSAPLHAEELGIDNPYAATAPLRLEQLLEQTAGLWDLTPREELPAQELNPPLAGVLGLSRHRLRWPPGTRFSPSPASFTAAALQLERWGHGSFAALAEAEVTRPLGLSCTSFRAQGELTDRLATGHRGAQPVEAQAQLHWPARGLVTCAADLSALLLSLLGRYQGGELHGRPLLPPALLERIWTSRTEQLPAGVPASGLGARAVIAEGRRAAGVGGALQGHAAELLWYPAEGVGYAVLLASESPAALARVAHVTRRFLLQGVRPAATPPAPPPDQARADVQRAAGTWRPVAPPSQLRLLLDELLGFGLAAARGDGLAWSFSLGQDRLLVPAGNGTFRDPAAAAPAFALVTREGRDELVTPEGSFVRAFAPWVFLRLALVGAALLALLASAAFALVWLPRALLGPLKGAPDLRMRAIPALAAVVLAEWLFLWSEAAQPLGALNLTTALLAVLGLVYAALALAGLLEALRPLRAAVPKPPAVTVHLEGTEPVRAPAPVPTRAARAVRSFCLATSLLAVWLAGLLAWYGLLGVRTWAL